MLSSLTKGRLLGISLAFLVISGAIGLKVSGETAAVSANVRRPGDAAPVETPAVPAPAAPLTLKEFSSQEELAAWAKNTVTAFQQADKINPPVYPKLVVTSVWDCDDYSERLQRKAISDGYLVSMQLITNGSLLDARVTNYVGDHMANITIIGNNMYYIEAMDGHVALIGPKD